MTHTLVLISVVNACFVLLGIWGAKRLIVQPVLLVAAGARRIADGAYGHHVQAVTNDEIGALAESFNHMSDRLDETVKALQASELAHTQKARELAEKASELAVINADLEQYTYAASHDLQEPLRMVSTYSQMLSLKYKNILGSDGELYLSFIGAGASRMQHLIKDLLSYNRVLHTPASRESADANASLQAALTDCTVGVGEANATVQCSALPSVLANPTDLELVFQNLLSNSIKYRSTSPREIRVAGTTEDGVATFRVSDNGMGIAPEYHERIFGLFKRLHGRDVPGTGMGLALTKRIIEEYGGQIRVESRLGEGATFIFTLPTWDRQRASAVASAQA